MGPSHKLFREFVLECVMFTKPTLPLQATSASFLRGKVKKIIKLSVLQNCVVNKVTVTRVDGHFETVQ